MTTSYAVGEKSVASAMRSKSVAIRVPSVLGEVVFLSG